MPRAELTAIENALADAGRKLAGIAHAGSVPTEPEAFREWADRWFQRLSSGDVPFIAPAAPQPSRHRFLAFGLAAEAASIVLLASVAVWQGAQRKSLEKIQRELNAPSNELNAASRRINELKAELAAMSKEQSMRERVTSRRGALHALLYNLAATRPEDVVVRKIQADGPSSLIISGTSLDASAVDELSIVLGRTLRGAGWTAQPRHKSAKDKLPNGGPWEFSLSLSHEETNRPQAVALNQEDGK
jgi:hypothetical protein